MNARGIIGAVIGGGVAYIATRLANHSRQGPHVSQVAAEPQTVQAPARKPKRNPWRSVSDEDARRIYIEICCKKRPFHEVYKEFGVSNQIASSIVNRKSYVDVTRDISCEYDNRRKPATFLPCDSVKEIEGMILENATVTEIMERYGIVDTTVSLIVNGKHRCQKGR